MMNNTHADIKTSRAGARVFNGQPVYVWIKTIWRTLMARKHPDVAVMTQYILSQVA